MSASSVGMWIAPAGGGDFWLSNASGACVKLPKVGCLVESDSLNTAPLKKVGGDYWVDLGMGNFGNKDNETVIVASLSAEAMGTTMRSLTQANAQRLLRMPR